MIREMQMLIATVVCPKCGRKYSLLNSPEYEMEEQPRRYPGTQAITFLCCDDAQTVQPEDLKYYPKSGLLIDKDDYRFQRARVQRVANELAPGKTVEFDEATPWIKFRIRDGATRTNLTAPSGEWEPSVLADKSDDWLRAFMKHLGNGKI